MGNTVANNKQILVNLYPEHKYLNTSSGHLDNPLPDKFSAGQLWLATYSALLVIV